MNTNLFPRIFENLITIKSVYISQLHYIFDNTFLSTLSIYAIKFYEYFRLKYKILLHGYFIPPSSLILSCQGVGCIFKTD